MTTSIHSLSVSLEKPIKTLETFVKNIANNMNKLALDDAHYFESNQKIEDIKRLIDSDADAQKMEGMKRLIAQISKGKDVSSLFPAVVKNVISKNVELKKLVYMYLVHYAELEPDSALLAINTFQKDLSASSQWIRASALRVMSSIRVKIIVQIIVLAIQKCVKDTSPYVRKAAAHAISKVYALDHDHKDELIEIIKILLVDRSTLVLGSAIAAWTEVCPERFDLIHPHFRKLCNLLADLDEWGQVIVLNMLIRYGRTQFEDPNKEKSEKPPKKKNAGGIKWSDDEEEEEDSEESEESDDDFRDLDPDHRLLLDSALPLLKNRNAGVVLNVASLFYHLAPVSEAQKVGKALVRISKSRREISYVVLANIVTMAASRPSMFEGALTEFFVSPTDPSFCRNLKLEIITHLVNQDNINKILKEFKTYVQMEDKQFVAATIQAMGRCAASVPEVTDRCLYGLMSLITNRSETVVAESVVIIKQLLQMLTESEEHEATMKEVISNLAKLLETITVPSARASIIWVIGEYSHKVPLLAPDILRKLAKSFANEDATVKLQILNLGSKLCLTNPEQTHKFFEYVLTLAKYDVNYDVRDRARIMRKVMLGESKLKGYAKNLFVTKKPVPSQVAPSEGRQRFVIGSMSHLMNHTVFGYQPLSDFPETAPPRSVRDELVVEISPTPAVGGNKAGTKKKKSFWSDEEDEEDEEESENEFDEEYASGEEEEDEDEEDDEDEEEDEEDEEEEEEEDEPPKKPVRSSKQAPPKKNEPISSNSKKEQSIEDLFNFGSSSSQTSSVSTKSSKAPTKPASSTNLIDDLFGAAPVASSPISPKANYSSFGLFSSDTPKRALLKHVMGGGLGIEYSYVRAPSMIGALYNTIQLSLKNHSQKPITNIKIGKLTLIEGMELVPFEDISSLGPGESVDSQISIKFSSVSQPAKFEISTDSGTFNVTLAPNIGDLVRATPLSTQEFLDAEKSLKGMNELSETATFKDVQNDLPLTTQRVLQCAYLSTVDVNYESGLFRFAGRTMISDELVLLSVVVDRSNGTGKLTINSENTVLNAMLLKQIKSALQGQTQ